MASIGDSEFTRRRREENRSVLKIVKNKISNKGIRDKHELYDGTNHYAGAEQVRNQAHLERLMNSKEAIHALLRRGEEARQIIKDKKIRIIQEGTATPEEKEARHLSLFEKRMLQYRGSIKANILEDTINEFYTTIQQVRVSYKSATKHHKQTPVQAVQLIAQQRTFPYITTTAEAYEAIYIAKQLYDEDIIDPAWDNTIVDEKEASLLCASIYCSSLLEGKDKEEALNEVMTVLEEEYGHAVNRDIALDYLKNTVYRKYRPK